MARSWSEPLVRRPPPATRRGDEALEAEADAAGRAVASGSRAAVAASASPALRRCACGGSCPSCRGDAVAAPAAVHEVLASPGRPLEGPARARMEAGFGADFSGVRVHDDARAAASARAVSAHAYAVGGDVVFAAGRYAPGTPGGDRLLAHELAHTLQQASGGPRLQRAPADDAGADLTGALTDAEWSRVEMWQSYGEVGSEPLTEDADYNATLMAASIFCSRLLFSGGMDAEAPLMCVDEEDTRADPRVRVLAAQVAARGPIVHWAAVPEEDRMVRVMELLVDVHGFPVNGAAGVVGNLWSESGVLPSRIEGSRIGSPMTARGFTGRGRRDFTADEVMNRDAATRTGPRKPGIGLAQWTSAPRREGLFQHVYQGRQLGASILFNLDAQVDYLVTELQASYPGVYRTVTRAGVSADDAADEVVYRFEVPGAILQGGNLLPRANARVQAVFQHRRVNAQRALRAYRAVHP